MTKFKLLLTIALLSLLGTACKKNKTTEQLGTAEPTSAFADNSMVSLDLVQLLEQGKMPAAEEVTIKFDHVFKRSKVYQAYSFKALLEPYLKQLDLDSTSDASLTFFCTDGYKPTQKLSTLLSGEGFLAFRDESITDTDSQWADSIQAKFSPFYLVWKDVPEGDQTFNWSYGLYQIDIHPVDQVYGPIYPNDEKTAVAGFEYFQQYCIKCHSINRIGGNLGPEFNDPKSITTYWTVEDMWAYAKNPQSFRYNARMHPMTMLTRVQFDEIITYLKYISEVKLEEPTQ